MRFFILKILLIYKTVVGKCASGQNLWMGFSPPNPVSIHREYPRSCPAYMSGALDRVVCLIFKKRRYLVQSIGGFWIPNNIQLGEDWLEQAVTRWAVVRMILCIIWVNRKSRERYVPILYWNGSHWIMNLNRLSNPWNANDLFLVPRNSFRFASLRPVILLTG